MINQMFGDTLWIWTAIVGALLGAAFLAWFKDTNLGLWSYNKFNKSLEYLATCFGWSWLQDPINGWRVRYPDITRKIDELESRIAELEKK